MRKCIVMMLVSVLLLSGCKGTKKCAAFEREDWKNKTVRPKIKKQAKQAQRERGIYFFSQKR